MTNENQKKIVWITGASTGIGAALARKLLSNNYRVIVTARSPANLQPLLDEFPSDCIPLVMDLTESDALDSTRNSLAQITPYLDAVILNAGTCEYIDVKHFTAAPFNTVMNINFIGAVNTLELALPFLRKAQGRAHILGVSSMATHLPMPRSQAYGGSKVALEYLLNSLRVDLAAEPIDVSVIRPGFVKTPLTDRNDFPMPFLITPEEAAEYIFKGMEKRQWMIQFPWPLVAIMSVTSWLPLRLQTMLLKKMSRNQE